MLDRGAEIIKTLQATCDQLDSRVQALLVDLPKPVSAPPSREFPDRA
jgi:hypothetical protein